MKWTQKELEALYSKVNERALNDPEFREKVVKDVRAALEEVAGCELPEELGLKYIEKDNSFRSTYVTPDFAQGEINVDELRNVGGGAGGAAQAGSYKNKQTNGNDVGVFLIVSICGAAAQIGPDLGLCGLAACPADACVGQACGAKACAGYACAGQACAAKGSAAEGCGADACGADAVAFHACAGAYACGAEATGTMACSANVCGAEASIVEVCAAHGCGTQGAGIEGCLVDAAVIGACGIEGCGADGCGAQGCVAQGCGIDACGADACGADVSGTGVEYVDVCQIDALVLHKPLGYDLPDSEIDICGRNFDGIISEEAAVNDAE